jgi:hypothetical protein
MDNPETLETWGTQDTGRRKTNHKSTTNKQTEQHGTHQQAGMNTGARDV